MPFHINSYEPKNEIYLAAKCVNFHYVQTRIGQLPDLLETIFNYGLRNWDVFEIANHGKRIHWVTIYGVW